MWSVVLVLAYDLARKIQQKDRRAKVHEVYSAKAKRWKQASGSGKVKGTNEWQRRRMQKQKMCGMTE